MLSLLHIENIALIQSADIRFEPGFNVLTGETGAGKSIVIDSIGAVLGERTSRELIRTGAKSALVTAVFTQVPPLPWLEENGFPTGEEELLLQRELQGDGRNVCRIDGKLVTVAQLRELGRQLLNIHGQHDGQQLWTRPVTWAIWTSSAGASLCWSPTRRPTASGTTSAGRWTSSRWTRRSAPAG